MNEQEFLQQIRQHQRIIHKVCAMYAPEVSEREDLFQEILMQAWRGATNFRQEAKFSTWLYQVGLNTAISHYRKSKIRLPFRAIDPTLMQLADTPPADDTELNAMYKAIGRLDDVDKALVMLYLDDFDYNTIGEMLGISANYVAVKMKRIKAKLQETVHQYL